MPRPQNKYKRQTGRISPRWLFLLLGVWIGLLVFIGANRQNILDAWRLHDYNAPAEVSSLAAQDTMTPYAKKVFYVNRPSIRDKNVFSTSCPNNGGEQTIVLGCYHGGQNGIFLLRVSDPRLGGVQQVTAAHEMLHGAYDRLSDKDRKRVDALLNEYYEHDLHDQRILNTIAAYKKSEPHDVTNEMHSVFGTEIADLPSELQTYYKRYFDNRAQVVAYASQYQQEFTSRQATISQDDAQLKDLKSQIDSLERQLKENEEIISKNQATLNGLRSSGDTTAYNAGVPAYNQTVRDYNTQVDKLHALIDQYNQLVAERNAVAGEVDTLVKDLSPQATSIQ